MTRIKRQKKKSRYERARIWEKRGKESEGLTSWFTDTD
jgi:hypothetical protein